MGSEFDGLSGYDRFARARVAEHNSVAVAEDVFELSFLVVSGTRAYVVRRPLVPVVRGSEAARKPEG